jgi:6-phospho-beta-glucosidase
MAQIIKRGAPHADVFNLVAPLGITTRLFHDEGLRAVGVCELPLVTLETWAERPLSELHFDYAGLNHVGWLWNVRGPNGEFVIARAISRRLVDAATVVRFGAAPLRYYYELFDRAAGERLGLGRAPGRAAALAHLSEGVIAALGDRADAIDAELDRELDAALDARPTPWFDRALVPLCAARFGGAPWDGFVNLPHASTAVRLAGVAPDVVVETAARVTADAIVPRAPSSPPPPAVSAFTAMLALADDLAYRAARYSDASLFAAAVAALPLPLDTAALPALVSAAIAPPPPLDALMHG